MINQRHLEAVGLIRQADRDGLRRHAGKGHVLEYHNKTGRWTHYKNGKVHAEGNDHQSLAEHVDKTFYAPHGPAGEIEPSQHSEQLKPVVNPYNTSMAHLQEAGRVCAPIPMRPVAKTTSQHSEEEITDNEGYGYHGEMHSKHGVEGSHAAYNRMHSHVMKVTGASHEEARHFLDSTHGRHLANNEQHLKPFYDRFKKTYNPEQYSRK